LLRNDVPDVLLSDVGMPGMDGYDFVGAVRSRLGLSAERLPAAAITAFVRPEDRARALKAGFQAHIEKPLRTQLLIRTVLDLVRGATVASPDPADRPVRH
ncbi:MAG: response regulator, partial [Caldimonas sp.]